MRFDDYWLLTPLMHLSFPIETGLTGFFYTTTVPLWESWLHSVASLDFSRDMSYYSNTFETDQETIDDLKRMVDDRSTRIENLEVLLQRSRIINTAKSAAIKHRKQIENIRIVSLKSRYNALEKKYLTLKKAKLALQEIHSNLRCDASERTKIQDRFKDFQSWFFFLPA
jgi:hypothetical protein